MAHANGHVDNIQLGSLIADDSPAIEVIKRANKELAHGNWNMNSKERVQAYADELSGKEIKQVRADFVAELKRIEDLKQAIFNARRGLSLALAEPTVADDDRALPFD